MIEPQAMLRRPPPIFATAGLHHHTGNWADAYGIVNPVVRVDRMAETSGPAWEALMFHEGLHVHERHALAGLLLFVFCLPLWVWWRREQEVRSDSFAMRGTSVSAFRAFTLLHSHPAAAPRRNGRSLWRWFWVCVDAWFWRWCYGRSREHRLNRARERCRRNGWPVAW